MTDQQTLPANVQENYRELSHLGFGAISRLINLRAGRTPATSVEASTIIQQFNLIESELLEGKRAAAEGNVEQVRDAIADIILLAAGQEGHIQELDVAEDFKRMCAFNMTRIPTSRDEAAATVEKYAAIGIEAVMLDPITVGGTDLFPVVTADKEQWDTEKNEHYPPRKFLKSINFVDVTYEPLMLTEIVGGGVDVEHLVGTQFTSNHLDMIKTELEQENLLSEEVVEVLERLVGKRA